MNITTSTKLMTLITIVTMTQFFKKIKWKAINPKTNKLKNKLKISLTNLEKDNKSTKPIIKWSLVVDSVSILLNSSSSKKKKNSIPQMVISSNKSQEVSWRGLFSCILL